VADDKPPELSASQRRALLALLTDELRRAYDAALAAGATPGEIAARLDERRRRLRSDAAEDVQHRPRDAGQFRVVGE
jgi:hypothetical protein